MFAWLTPARWSRPQAIPEVVPVSDPSTREVSAVADEGRRDEVGSQSDSKYDEHSQPQRLDLGSQVRNPSFSPEWSESASTPRGSRNGGTPRHSSDTGGATRKDLPKIEYSKLVNLSLTNLDDYLTSIYNLGYSRMWNQEYYQPTLYNIRDQFYPVYDQDQGSQKSIVHREAYLVLLNTIPPSLKYLVREVEVGDVMGIGRRIFDRFLHITPEKKRLLQNEWNALSMDTLGMSIDKFAISHIYLKANNLKRYGIKVNEEDMVQTFVTGLSKDFDWFRHHRRMFPGSVSLAEACK